MTIVRRYCRNIPSRNITTIENTIENRKCIVESQIKPISKFKVTIFSILAPTIPTLITLNPIHSSITATSTPAKIPNESKRNSLLFRTPRDPV